MYLPSLAFPATSFLFQQLRKTLLPILIGCGNRPPSARLGRIRAAPEMCPRMSSAREQPMPPKKFSQHLGANTLRFLVANTESNDVFVFLGQEEKRQPSHRVYHCKIDERDEVLQFVCLLPLSCPR